MIDKIIIILLFLYSCKTVDVPSSTSCNIDSLKIEIKKNWKLNTDSTFYSTNDDFYISLESNFKNCIIGSSESKIIDLFGSRFETGTVKSDSTLKSFMKYYITPPCKVQQSQCGYLIFYIGIDGKVKTFSELFADPNIEK